MFTPEDLQYHATVAWVHLSTIADHEKELALTDTSMDVLFKAIALMHVLFGGEDARENGSKTDSEIINN